MTSKSDALWPDDRPLDSLKMSERLSRLASYFLISSDLWAEESEEKAGRERLARQSQRLSNSYKTQGL